MESLLTNSIELLRRSTCLNHMRTRKIQGYVTGWIHTSWIPAPTLFGVLVKQWIYQLLLLFVNYMEVYFPPWPRSMSSDHPLDLLIITSECGTLDWIRFQCFTMANPSIGWKSTYTPGPLISGSEAWQRAPQRPVCHSSDPYSPDSRIRPKSDFTVSASRRQNCWRSFRGGRAILQPLQ